MNISTALLNELLNEQKKFIIRKKNEPIMKKANNM